MVDRNNELYHYGVLGMKWGVRRYQNYDGTLKKTSEESSKREEAIRKYAKDKATYRLNNIDKTYDNIADHWRRGEWFDIATEEDYKNLEKERNQEKQYYNDLINDLNENRNTDAVWNFLDGIWEHDLDELITYNEDDTRNYVLVDAWLKKNGYMS